MIKITGVEFLNDVDPALLSEKILQKLQLVQLYSELNLKVTSGFRSAEKDRAVGGTGHGSHTRGMAVDILCTNGTNAFKILNACIKAGLTRFGYEPQHFHIDCDASLAQSVFWRL